MRTHFLLGALLIWACSFHALAQPQLACGALENHYGPFDYRVEKGRRLNIVEGAHFTPEVEALVAGKSTRYVGGDISYTLRTSPNHHRALLSVMRFAARTKSLQPPHMEFSVDCYFDRAVRFRPDDTVVRALFAQFLHSTGRTSDALRQLAAAVQFAKDNPFSHYNIGLVYFELNAYSEAMSQAHTAISLGMDPVALKERLQKVGRWREPDPVSPAPPESAASTPQGAGLQQRSP